VSGGVEGARNGACMMIGGKKEKFQEYEELFRDLNVTDGYGYMGSSGAGHYVKMVHNAIEYGMMAAIAEGVSVIDSKKGEFGTDIKEVIKTYAHGSIIESKLMTWLQRAWEDDPGLADLPGTVPFGETEEEMHALVEKNDMPVLSVGDMSREITRDESSFRGQIINALRQQFGGHNPHKKS